MKKSLLFIILALGLAVAGCGNTNPKVDSPYVSEKGDTLVVDTTVPGEGIIGYRGQVPIQVYVVKGRVADIVLGENSETPRFIKRVYGIITPNWIGLRLKDAAKAEVDAVTGATLSSNALIENFRLAMKELGY
ncbi:MAG: FMN-binding protein [Bacteroidales bacterium]|nr:FMN-binding protein [Bacteroidales bacterium]